MRTRKKTKHVVWDEVKLRRIYVGYKNPRGRAVLDAAAENPGKLVSFRGVLQELGCSRQQLCGALRSLSTFINTEFGLTGEYYNWPAAETVRDEDNLTYYVMAPEVAAIWNGFKGQ